MAIPEIIRQAASDIRHKIYGRDVRESIAKGIEVSGEIAEESNNRSKDTAGRQDHIEARYDVAVGALTEESELLDARVDAEGNEYPLLKDRLDESDSQLAKNETKVTKLERKTNWVTPLEYGGVGDNVADDTQALKDAVIEAVEKDIPLEIPDGYNFKVTEPIPLQSRLKMRGKGKITFTSAFLFTFNDPTKNLQYLDFKDVYFTNENTSQQATFIYVKCKSFSYNQFDIRVDHTSTVLNIIGSGWLNKVSGMYYNFNVTGSSLFIFDKLDVLEVPSGYEYNGYHSTFDFYNATLYGPGYKIQVKPGSNLDVVNISQCELEGGLGIFHEGENSIYNINNCYFDGMNIDFRLGGSATGKTVINAKGVRSWAPDGITRFQLSGSAEIVLNVEGSTFTGNPATVSAKWYIANYSNVTVNGHGNSFENPVVALRSKSGVELAKIRRFDGLPNGEYIDSATYWLPPNTTHPTEGFYPAGTKLYHIDPVLGGPSGGRFTVMGWVKMNTGSTNVLGVDWLEMKTNGTVTT